jgi:hypothetical protein
MGAIPSENFALAFLRRVFNAWLDYPDEYRVEELEEGLIPALTQLCITWISTQTREALDRPGAPRELHVPGALKTRDVWPGNSLNGETLALKRALNKIVHGNAHKVKVVGDSIWICFASDPFAINDDEDWSFAWLSGDRMISECSRALQCSAVDLELQRGNIDTLFERLGEMLLPHQS